MTEALPKATLGLRLTLLSAYPALRPRHDDPQHLCLASNFLPVSGHPGRSGAELAAAGRASHPRL